MADPTVLLGGNPKLTASTWSTSGVDVQSPSVVVVPGEQHSRTVELADGMFGKAVAVSSTRQT